MYTTIDFLTKKALKEAVFNGTPVKVYQLNADLTETTIPTNGTVFLEGPHYPRPHTWYAQATLVNGVVVKVK